MARNEKSLMDIEQASASFWWMQEYYTAEWKQWVLSNGLSFIGIFKGKDNPLHSGHEDFIVHVDNDGQIVHGTTPGGLAKRAVAEIVK